MTITSYSDHLAIALPLPEGGVITVFHVKYPDGVDSGIDFPTVEEAREEVKWAKHYAETNPDAEGAYILKTTVKITAEVVE